MIEVKSSPESRLIPTMKMKAKRAASNKVKMLKIMRSIFINGDYRKSSKPVFEELVLVVITFLFGFFLLSFGFKVFDPRITLLTIATKEKTESKIKNEADERSENNHKDKPIRVFSHIDNEHIKDEAGNQQNGGAMIIAESVLKTPIM